MLTIKTKVKKSILPQAGKGLFTDEPVLKGQIIWRVDQESYISGQTYDTLVAKGLEKWFRTYATQEAYGEWYLDKDNTRFMNHSEAAPNIQFINNEVCIALVDIPKNSELFCNYYSITTVEHANELLRIKNYD